MTQRRQHDAAGDHSAQDKCVDAVGPEDHIEIRAHEGADPALGDDDLTRIWRDTRYHFDRMIYFNRAARRAFSLEFVEDHSRQELQRNAERDAR